MLQQRVYVRGGKKEEEEEIELEVYNQGMTKTELCNKWQETGTCPYGDHCQFAHGRASNGGPCCTKCHSYNSLRTRGLDRNVLCSKRGRFGQRVWEPRVTAG
ncbi:hypothetical protein Bca4012_009972 [Brassica carinata]